ncbi:MAG: hypothetical protein L3K52_17785 [Candidatus Thiothrix sulfatifontis]|nr:MAG: hypothetical protein L3K52_17785 [Candidatus Thiothrix sulfatifontis]
MMNNKIPLSNQTKFIILLFFLYFILPISGEYVLGSNFYIFSYSESLSKYFAMFAFCVSFFFLGLTYIISKKSINSSKSISSLSRKILRIHFYLFLLFIFVLLTNGIYQRLTVGSDRIFLLSNLHEFLVSGVSFLFIGALVYIARYISKKYFYIIVFLFVLLDFIYLGKKFSYYAIALLLFNSDTSENSNKHLIYIGIFSIIIIIVISILRAVAADDQADVYHQLFSFYSYTSEFLGVYASIGHALDNSHLLYGTYFNLDYLLADFYKDEVGHGLALHPIAYFLILSKSYWWFLYIFYFSFLTLLIRLFSSTLGNLIILLLTINSVHFFRHGPDIFLYQVIQQSIYITLIIYFPKIINR